MKILYFGTVCDLAEYEKILERCRKKPTIATIVFESALLEGFFQNEADIEIFSCPMIPNYRDSKMLYWGRKHEQLDCGYTCRWIKTLNIMFLKQLTRRLDARKVLKVWLKKNKGNECVVMSYGISPFLTKEIISLSRRYGAKSCAIVPDLLRDMYLNSSKHSLKSWLRQQYLKPTLQIQGEFDSYVYLTEAMSKVINLDKPYIVMEGILNVPLDAEIRIDKKSVPRGIMYAGGINEKYGILNLIDAFEDASIPNTELWLFGEGNALKEAEARAHKNPKICVFGRRSREEVLLYEKKATLLVNPRSTKNEYTKYSFPSKTIEYMYSGTPLLTTKLQGIPEDYFQYVFTTEDNDTVSLSAALKEILVLSDEKLYQKGLQAKLYVMEKKNSKIQSKRILDFLKTKRDK